MVRGIPTWAHEGIRRLSVAHFLAAIAVWIVALPFLDQLANGEILESALFTLVLLQAVRAVGGHRRTLIIASILVTPAMFSTWLHRFYPDLLPGEFRLTTAIVFTAFVAMHMLRFILRAPKVNEEVLCAAIATFLLLGVLWAFGYMLAGILSPKAFAFTVGESRRMSGVEAVFFSFGTLTSNYGDVIPLSNAARMLAMTESTVGMFYVVVLIARLVSMYSSPEASEISATTDSQA